MNWYEELISIQYNLSKNIINIYGLSIQDEYIKKEIVNITSANQQIINNNIDAFIKIYSLLEQLYNDKPHLFFKSRLIKSHQLILLISYNIFIIFYYENSNNTEIHSYVSEPHCIVTCVERRLFLNKFDIYHQIFKLIQEKSNSKNALEYTKNFSKKNIKIILWLIKQKYINVRTIDIYSTTLENKLKKTNKKVFFLEFKLIYKNILLPSQLHIFEYPFQELNNDYFIAASYLSISNKLHLFEGVEIQHSPNVKVLNIINKTKFKFKLSAINQVFFEKYKIRIIEHLQLQFNTEKDSIDEIFYDALHNIHFFNKKINDSKTKYYKQISIIMDEVKYIKPIVLEYQANPHIIYNINPWFNDDDFIYFAYHYRILLKKLNILYKNIEILEENLQNYQKTFQKNFYIFNYFQSLKSGDVVFISHFRDFRGRLYPHSPIHPMYNHLSRLTIEIISDELNITKIERLKTTEYYKFIVKADIKWPLFLEESTHNISDLDKFILINILIEISKLKKTTLLTSDGASLNDFIYNAINIIFQITLQNNKILTKLEDELQYSKWWNIINKWQLTKQWGDLFIMKDSTGSSFQHWAILLQPKNSMTLDILNITNERWYDIYTIIINKFHEFLKKNNFNFDNNLLRQILKRHIVKPCIMTANYNVTHWRSQQYLIENIIAEYPTLIHNPEIKKQILQIHDIFYEFLTNDVFLLLFNISKLDYLENLKKTNQIKFIYKTKKIIKKQIEIDGHRCDLAYSYYDPTIDWKKTMRSLPANIVQSLDAELAEYLIQHMECIPIHDAFVVSIYDLGLLVDETNKFFRTKFNMNPGIKTNPFIVI